MLRPSLATAAALGMIAAGNLSCSDSSAPLSDTAKPTLQTAAAPTLTPQQSGTTNRLQAVSPVNEQVVWASGVGGTYTRTTDGGATWQAAVVPGAAALEFRDVEGLSASEAYLLAAGPGDQSRIYHTTDGGAHWTLQFQNQDPNGFYDCFAFWHKQRAITMADAVNGRFPAIRTNDGTHWKDIGDRLPAGQAGEAAFAASGTCVTTEGGNRAWIGTGGAPKARILATTNGGNSWQSYDVPILQGTGVSGVVSVDFRDKNHGFLGGGDVVASTVSFDNVARSSDGGKTWELATRTPFPGAVYGLTYVPGLTTTVVATGPGGSAWTPDEGGEWFPLAGAANFWAVAFASPGAGWLVGTEGRIVKVSF
jgi:photosystem II stability/assembly factor-like uncharacterized protein